MDLSPAVQAWRAGGRTVRACGMDVFVRDEGQGAVPLLVLHGMPSSSFDFASLWPALAARRRVVALDFPGYGFSDKPAEYSYSLLEQADVVEVVARALVDRPDDVYVTESSRRGMTVVELTTAPGDMGKIIGRQGRTAAALRTLVSLTAEQHGTRGQLDIRD